MRRELMACRTGCVLRMPRARPRGRGQDLHLFRDHDQPTSGGGSRSRRAGPLGRRPYPGCLGVRRSAPWWSARRSTLLLYLPRMAGHGHEARVKNGPALAGHGAEAVRDAISRTIVTLPEQLRRSLTWDQGVEMAQHARLKIEAGVRVYFCDPHSPWQHLAPTRTLTDCCASTSPKGPISACTAQTRLQPWPPPSTRGPGPAIGRHLQGRLTGVFYQPTKIVLRRPLESAQYTSVAFGARCKEAGVRPSTGSVGDAYDNAMCESFFATLECELIDRRRFRSHSEARMAVFQFIEGFYNPSRRHSALGYLSPIEYERKHDGLSKPA